jgi:hypothetical protein
MDGSEYNNLLRYLTKKEYNEKLTANEIFDFWCFNATFNNISVISWRPVLAVEEAGVTGDNHRP